MKPFSARYFLLANKSRCLLLIFMFMLSYIAWLGGLYVTNIATFFQYSVERYDNYTVFWVDDEDMREEAWKAAEDKEGITVLRSGVTSNIYTQSIMGIENNYPCLSFLSVGDFKKYCNVAGISCDTENLKPGSLIMSRLQADNRGMKLGDKLDEREDETIYGTYYLDSITDEEGYSVYFIDTGKNGDNLSYILLADNISQEDFTAYSQELREKYGAEVRDEEYMQEKTEHKLSSFNAIYMFIAIFLAIVMAISINAAFVGMYQRRQPEFAVYRAIGIKSSRLFGKLAGEFLLLDGIGIVGGGILFFLGTYLLNHLYLIPQGLKLAYYHPLALLGMLLCNVLVLVLLVVTKSRQLLRADIYSY